MYFPLDSRRTAAYTAALLRWYIRGGTEQEIRNLTAGNQQKTEKSQGKAQKPVRAVTAYLAGKSIGIPFDKNANINIPQKNNKESSKQ